jgi:hypothetical protein
MRPTALAFAVAATCFATAATAACPPTTYLYGGLEPSIPIVVPAATQETTFTIQGCDRVYGRAQVGAGLLIASVDFACAAGGSSGPSGIETLLDDDFTVVGLPNGTPVTFDAVLDLDGLAQSFSDPGGGGGGRVRGAISLGTTSEVISLHSTDGLHPTISVHESITLPLSGTAGTPQTLRFHVRGEALEGRATLQGLFHFANLPPGAHVTSCRGYSSDAPVRARTSTWGQLKLRYR